MNGGILLKHTDRFSRCFSAVGFPLSIFLSAFLLAVLSGSLFFSMSDSSADQGDALINASVQPTIAITTSADTNGGVLGIPITPTPSGTSGNGVLYVYVSANNPTGYTLTMDSDSNDTDLINSSNSAYTIPSAPNLLGTAPAALSVNTWGYAPSGGGVTLFQAIRPLSTPDTVNVTNAPDANSSKVFTFGALVDTTKPADIYVNTMVFTATTNYVPPSGLKDGMYMQEATTARCIATAPGAMVSLIDERDDKVYRVKKIVDGNCWIVDSLAFSIHPPGDPSVPAFDPDAELDPSVSRSLNAQFAKNSGDFDIPNNGNPTTSYLYNWCAALGDTSQDCQASQSAN
jgi:hypothetical protein